MSIEVIKKVTESERNAQEMKQEAAVNAKKTVSDAERAGRELLQKSREKAELQVKQFMTEAEEKAAKSEQIVIEETTRACETLRQSAQERLPEAARLIVGRVVNI